MNDFSPLLDRHRPQDAVAFQSQHMISAAQFLNEVTQLAARLPRKRYMLNLCEDRYNFLVSFAAALQVRQVSLLPPSHASNTLRQLCADYPDAYCLADHAEVPDALTLMAFPNDLQRSAGACAIPDIPGKQTAAIVFTSGSTGRPTPHVKNWASLTAIARAVGKRIALAPGAGIIGTIPPQHLYGLETTIMLPLQWGCGLHHARPLLPADIQFALGQMPRPCWLMTTPLHLRACIKAGMVLENLAGVLSATMPLTPELARAVEASWQAPVHDVYGCTEAGIIALRRVAHDETWRAVDGVRVWNENGTAWAQGGHVPRAVPLADQISVHGEQEFSLHGRLSDMVKIAGKRASLQALNAELNKIPGVMDAVYFVPDGNNGRLSAFVVAPGLSAQMIITELRKNIDPVFLPRPLHVVAALPRNASGKLPRENLLALAAALPHSRSR